MGKLILVFVAVWGITAAASSVAAGDLKDELFNTVAEHIRKAGPDEDAVRFVKGYSGPDVDGGRILLWNATKPYIGATDPKAAAAAVQIAAGLRQGPLILPFPLEQWKKDNAAIFQEMDATVAGNMVRLLALNDAGLTNALTMYWSEVDTDAAHAALWKILDAAPGDEQTMICLTWRRDPADMPKLLDEVLAHPESGWSLPYHFATAYGEKSVPALLRMLNEGNNMYLHQCAAYELVRLKRREGFEFLMKYLDTLSLNTTATDSAKIPEIIQWVTDNLRMPRGAQPPTAKTTKTFLEDKLKKLENGEPD